MADVQELQASAPAPSVTVAGAQAGELARLLRDRVTPLVLNVKKSGKKRKRSGNLKEFQRALWGSTKATDRLSSAFSEGLKTFRKRSDKSSRNKKDGLLKDLYKNSAAGLSKTLRESSSVPRILAKSVKGKTIRRRIRLMSRLMG
ncbi:hypothetical protein WMF30_51810 [Sorangium sp. So ce134]